MSPIRSKPKLIHHQLTGGIGVHRFDMDDALRLHLDRDGGLHRQTCWSSTTCAIRNARREVSRWWLPGQNIAAGEKPSWSGKRHRLHHALRFGNEMFASCWHGGFRIVDVADLTQPKTVASLQLSSAVSRADAYVDAGARARSAASASRSPSTKRTRRRAPVKKRRAAAACMREFQFSTCPITAQCEAALAVRGERTRIRRSPARRARASARTSSTSA